MKDLLTKLTSRKFWAMIIAIVVSVMTMANCQQDTIVQVTGLITSISSVVAYIFGEAYVDKKGDNNE